MTNAINYVNCMLIDFASENDLELYLKSREEKIMIQLTHLKNKQLQEINALEIKLDRIYKETDGKRKT